MQISKIVDLTSFLRRWYAISDLSVSPASLQDFDKIPRLLIDAWVSFGQLSIGYDQWCKIGVPSPLACQDGFIASGFLTPKDGFISVVMENQGNWTIGYRENDQASDPEVFSDFLEQEIGGTGFVPTGGKLSELIITSVLTETTLFGAMPTDEAQSLEASCDCELWIGRYYNAVGFGKDYETPSHRIRTNSDQSVLALDWGEGFSGFAAHRGIGRKRLQEFI